MCVFVCTTCNPLHNYQKKIAIESFLCRKCSLGTCDHQTKCDATQIRTEMSSKALEPKMTDQLVTKLIKDDMKPQGLCADNDSSMIKLCEKYGFMKFDDVNHVFKCIYGDIAKVICFFFVFLPKFVFAAFI